MTHPYRAPIPLEAQPRWTSPWMRFVVKVKRRLSWTLAARRCSWREQCRYIESLDRRKEGTGHVVIRADNGSVVKNVYVDHGRLGIVDSVLLWDYRESGRQHSRMPRA